jgi:hypothetical protein
MCANSCGSGICEAACLIVGEKSLYRSLTLVGQFPALLESEKRHPVLTAGRSDEVAIPHRVEMMVQT